MELLELRFSQRIMSLKIIALDKYSILLKIILAAFGWHLGAMDYPLKDEEVEFIISKTKK